MRQAFIIMQIGNSDLDRVCADAIVPALKSCNLDPKRVDKHNEGRLLKSEIVGFIESSDIIVADLTNERPNCYLEVGYAMGLDKFRNLILTAREDHNPSNPNYKPRGPKVHFDLSGYDILFWDPKNLTTFRKELEKRVMRRLATSIPHLPNQLPAWDEKWISQNKKVAILGLMGYGKRVFMEIRMMLPDFTPNLSQRELLSVAEQAQIDTYGWPLGIVFRDVESWRPKAKTDGIVAEIRSDGDESFDYWAIRKDGAFYLLRSILGYMKGKTNTISFNTRICRITEALLYAVRLYSGFKVPSDSRVLIGIRHGGLKDHRGAIGIIPRFTGKSAEDVVYTEVETTLEKIESDLVNLVERFTQPLFVLFDFYKLDRHLLEKIVNNFVKGKVT